MAWPDEALNELIEAIQSGTRLDVPSHVRAGFTGRYHGPFRSQSECSWPPIKCKILDLGEVVGSVADVLTRAKALDLGEPIPASVDEKCAYYAGRMVREEICPPLGHPGVWCEGYTAQDVDGSPAFLALVESVRILLRNTKPDLQPPSAG